MKCTMTRRDGRPCWNWADRMAGGLAVCKWHEPAALRLFRAVDANNSGDPLWEKIKAGAIADVRVPSREY